MVIIYGMVIIFSSLEVTTQDSVTPSFTISSALRSGSQNGPEVSYATVGDQLWWTIDIPCMLYQCNYVTKKTRSTRFPTRSDINLHCTITEKGYKLDILDFKRTTLRSENKGADHGSAVTPAVSVFDFASASRLNESAQKNCFSNSDHAGLPLTLISIC